MARRLPAPKLPTKYVGTGTVCAPVRYADSSASASASSSVDAAMVRLETQGKGQSQTSARPLDVALGTGVVWGGRGERCVCAMILEMKVHIGL